MQDCFVKLIVDCDLAVIDQRLLSLRLSLYFYGFRTTSNFRSQLYFRARGMQ